MLSIAFDPYFPQIPVVLEPQRMRSILQLLIFKSTDPKKPRLVVEKCTIGEKRHKPGSSFLLSYHLDIVNIETGVSFQQILTGKLYPPGLGITNYLKINKNETLASDKIPAISHLPGLSMIIWAFPHDRKLKNLDHFLNVEFIKQYFTQRSDAFKLNKHQTITSVEIETLHYLPERSSINRYQITASNDDPVMFKVYGKHYRDDSGNSVFSTMDQLSRQISNSAQALHYDDENKIVWQSHVEGQPFSWQKSNMNQHQVHAEKLAECVAQFHQCHLSCSDNYDHKNIEHQLIATLQSVAKLPSDLSERAKHQINELLSELSHLDWSSEITSPLHMDLKTQNFLITSDRAVLIDLDCVTVGDHLIDIGSLIANFYLNGLRANFTMNEIETIVKPFTDKYLNLIPWPINQACLHWYTAAAFIHEVLRRTLRQCDEQRMGYIDAYIELSECYLRLCQTGY